MSAPVIRQFLGTIPDKGQSQTAFDTNVDAFLDWQALQFAPDLVAFGTFASATGAALVAANLPPLTGQAASMVRVNAAADGVEFRTPAQMLADIGAATAAQGALADSALQSVASLTQTQAEDDASTVFGTVSGQRLGQAVKDNLNASGSAPTYACRAWVNFNGTGTVAIRASGNVSSITDNGTGDYTVNFTTAITDANYAWVGSCMTSATATNERGTVQQRTDQTSTTTALPISTTTGVNGTQATNVAVVNIAIFR